MSKEHIPDKPVSAFSLIWDHGKVAIITWLLLVAFCLIGYTVSGRKAGRLEAGGVTTEGTVATVTTSTVYRDGERRLQDRTVFTFTTEEGSEVKQTITGRPYKPTQTGSRVGARYKTGQKLTIRYLPENPNVYEIGEDRSRKDSEASLRLAYLVFGVPLLYFLYLFGRIFEMVHIRERGEPKRVKACSPPTEASNSDRQKYIYWKLDKDTLGQSYTLKNLSQRPKAGTTITVYTKGKKSVWEGDVGPSKRSNL